MSPSATASRQAPQAAPKRDKPRSGPVTRTKAPKPAIAEVPVAVEVEASKAPDLVTDVLDSYNFDYKLVELDISLIDRKQSELNQARISKPIDADQVVLYAEAMERGDKFPPIVVYKHGSSYITMDGNHRVAAADIASKPGEQVTLLAYVVNDPAPAQVQAFTYEANTKHGLPTSLQDRLRQAIHLIKRGSHKAVDASRQLGIPLNTLRSALDQYEADQRFDTLGVRKLLTLSPTTKRRLDSIHSDPVLVAAGNLVLDAGLGGDDLARLVRETNALRSEREQMAYIAREREARAGLIKATAGGRMPIKQSLVTLARMTSTLNRMDVDAVIRDLREMPADVRKEHAAAASETVTRLMQIIRDIQNDGAK